MSINLRVVEYQTWGRYLSIYTVYRIDVRFKDEEWFVFRRFSEFMDMHNRFLNDKYLKELADPLTEILPQKEYFGSALSTFDRTCTDRMQKFTTYLQGVLEEKPLRKSQHFLSFIDVQNKGISGIKRVLGVSQIIREEFTMCSLGKMAQLGFNAWVRGYICLTKKGWIYCTKCIYDSPDECDVKIDLKSKFTRIGGSATDGVLRIEYLNNKNLNVKFRDTSDFSSWLRQLSDFSITNAEKEALKEDSGKRERKQSVPKTHIKSAGTGKTEDELSQDFGI